VVFTSGLLKKTGGLLACHRLHTGSQIYSFLQSVVV